MTLEWVDNRTDEITNKVLAINENHTIDDDQYATASNRLLALYDRIITETWESR